MVVDLERRNATEIADAYLDLACMLCHTGRRIVVLLRAGTADAEVHYTLLDIVHTVSSRVVAMPLDLRVAMVGRAPGLAELVKEIAAPLRPCGCELQLFGEDVEAEAWLREQRAPVSRGASSLPRQLDALAA